MNLLHDLRQINKEGQVTIFKRVYFLFDNLNFS